MNGGIYAGKSYWVCTEANWDSLYQNPDQNYPVDEAVYNKSGGFGNGYVPLFCVVGYQNKVYYDGNDWLQVQAALRTAINGMPQPPVMAVSKSSFSPTCAPGASVADNFNIANSGAGPLNYSFSLDYAGVVAAGSTWHTNNFNAGIGYTVQSGWATTTGGTWNDGSQCANAASSTTPSVMTSAAFNTTGVGDRLWLEFRYGTSAQTGSSLKAEYYTGSVWQQVWYSTESGVGTAKIELPIKSANTQVRFTGVMKRVTGTWSIEKLDDIKVYSDDVSYRWVQFDLRNTWGEPTATGTIAAGNNQTFNVTFNATGLAAGTYNADIMVHTNYPPEIHKAIPVTFTVSSGTPPAVPTLVLPANASSTSDLTPTFDWNDVATATSYTIQIDDVATFASPNYTNSPTVSTYTPAANLAAGTWYWRVLATNANGSSAYTAGWSVVLGNVPAVPTLATPANASTTYDPTPTFDWNDVATATAYTIQLDNNSDFSSPVFTQSPSVSTYTPVAALTDGTYYWRVLATNAFGSSAYTASRTVTKASMLAPTGVTTTIVSGNVKIDWAAVAGAATYDVYSSADPYGTFTKIVTDTSLLTYTYTPGTNTKRFFYVVAKNALTKESPNSIIVNSEK